MPRGNLGYLEDLCLLSIVLLLAQLSRDVHVLDLLSTQLNLAWRTEVRLLGTKVSPRKLMSVFVEAQKMGVKSSGGRYLGTR